MPHSANHRNYPHIKVVLDEALARGGVRYTLETEAQARHFRHQAYHVRRLIQKEGQAGMPKGMTAPSPYDGMFIRLDGATCIIAFHEDKPAGKITDLAGKPITKQTKKYEAPTEGDELVEIAEHVKKGLIG